MGSADPSGKMDEKLKSENMQREQFSEWGVEAGVENGAMLTTHYSDILQNAPFRCQIFKKFLRRCRQGGIDPPNQNPVDALDQSHFLLACLFFVLIFLSLFCFPALCARLSWLSSCFKGTPLIFRL